MFNFMIIGFKEFESKKGKPCYIIEYLVPYSDKQKEYGSKGYYVMTKFLDYDSYKKLDESCIGCIVKFEYEVDDFGRSSVVDLEII